MKKYVVFLLSYTLFFFLVSCAQPYLPRENKSVFSFENSKHQTINVRQEIRKYGLDLIFHKKDEATTKLRKKKVKNSYGVILKNPSKVLLCSIDNGMFYSESYQILDLESFESIYIKVDSPPLEPQCLIEEKERFFLVYDTFPSRESMYIFDLTGHLVERLAGKLSNTVKIKGNEYKFLKGREFGGFGASKLIENETR